MSQDNVEIVRETIEAFNRDEESSRWHPEVVVVPPEGWPEGGEVVHGLAAWQRQMERLRDSWADTRLEIDDIRSVDEERVVWTLRWLTTGKDSGLAFETAMGAVYTVNDGLIVRGEFFRSPADALEAVGLSE
jgi:ketosteroid isomerase-like protein